MCCQKLFNCYRVAIFFCCSISGIKTMPSLNVSLIKKVYCSSSSCPQSSAFYNEGGSKRLRLGIYFNTDKSYVKETTFKESPFKFIIGERISPLNEFLPNPTPPNFKFCFLLPLSIITLVVRLKHILLYFYLCATIFNGYKKMSWHS